MAWRMPSAVLLVLLAGYVASVDRFPPVLTSVLVNGKPPSSSILPSAVDFQILCQSEGRTPIWWIVPDRSQSFAFPNGSLTIKSRELVYKDADYYDGTYTCFTNNTLGTAVASPIKVRFGVFVPPTAVTAVSRSVSTGDTVIFTCRGAGSGEVRPSSLDSAIDYVWYWQNIKRGDGGFGRFDFVQMHTQTKGRIAVDESNRLYIRNVQPSDFDPSTQFIGCRAIRGTYVSSELDVGMYTLMFSGTVAPLQEPAVIYSTPNVTVNEGGNFTLTCIFNDIDGKLQDAVTWNNVYTSSFENGARIQVANAAQQHNGTWECRYKNLARSVSVFVILNPRVNSITDTFATVGGTAAFTCNYQFADTVKWYKNDKEMDIRRADFSMPSAYTRVMTLQKVSKNDIGVYSCEVTSEVGSIRLNGRLIVTDPTVGNVSVNDAGKSVGTQVIVKRNTTSIKIGCSFTADPLIVNPMIIWRMSQFPEFVINDATDRPEYGLSKGSVITQVAALQSSLTFKVFENSAQNVIGNVTCILKYKILDKDFGDAAANSVELMKELDLPVAPKLVTKGEFPYWIIGVIIAALFLILLVFLIIFCVQRNKGEQYYVGDKERKAGHDPKEELPPWQEFNRPDQDPVKGSRASLEMEGDRPMGSDAGSMDEYGVDTDTGKFNEDGSFIGQYGPKGQRPGASGQV